MTTILSNQPNLTLQNNTSYDNQGKSLSATAQPNVILANRIEQDSVQISLAARQLFESENQPIDTEPSISADNGYGIRPPTGTTPPPTGGDGNNRDN